MGEGNGTRENASSARTGRRETRALNARIGRTGYAPVTTSLRLATAAKAQLARLLSGDNRRRPAAGQRRR